MYSDDEFDNGYVLLNRNIQNKAIFNNEKWLKVWIYCKLKANHKGKEVSIMTGRGKTSVPVKRGQFISGRNADSSKLGMNPSTFRNIIKKFQNMQIIDVKKDNHYSLITICDYDKIQDPEMYEGFKKDNQLDRQRTGKGQAKDTTKNVKNLKKEKKEALEPGPNIYFEERESEDEILEAPVIEIIPRDMEAERKEFMGLYQSYREFYAKQHDGKYPNPNEKPWVWGESEPWGDLEEGRIYAMDVQDFIREFKMPI